jgi:Glycosyl hydrolase family 26
VLSDTARSGRHRHAGLRAGRRRARTAATIGVVTVIVVVAGAFAVNRLWLRADPAPRGHAPGVLPTTPASYIGVYREGVPSTYGVVSAFSAATGVKPDVVTYYSGWKEPFQAGFAATVARHGAVPLVQINPTGVRLAAIAGGAYDNYLGSFAEAVRAYGHPVIVGFGHEMNGTWYSWAYTHTSPAVFVAAWRHIVTLFRGLGVRNVTWLWTVNVIQASRGIPSPAAWWPGSAYVNWIGMDGYYDNPSRTFAPLFGPTIAAVRQLTRDPILIAETAAAPAKFQPAKIADLFAGIRLYGLLGFVWFDVTRTQHWSLSSPAAIAAFRHGAKLYHLSA